MRLIKLDATSSTNDFLKNLAKDEKPQRFTVISAESQTAGRGQMGASWNAQSGKNLTFSVFTDVVKKSDSLFDLNVAVAVSLIKSLEKWNIPMLSIKWPNDIMSGKRKIAGILIESVFRPDGSIWSIVGIGLNVNQTNFDGLPQAGSMQTETGQSFDRYAVLESFMDVLEEHAENLDARQQMLWQSYHDLLFCSKKAASFETPDGHRFAALIREVDSSGRLILETEDGSLRSFGIKEVKLLF